MMKRIIVTIACAAGFLFSTTSAQASTLNIADAYYLGFIDSATPASPAHMLANVNYLANLGAGQTQTNVTSLNNGHAFTFSRSHSTVSGDRANADLSGYIRGGGDTIANVSGFSVVVAKYGTIGHVWVLDQLSGPVKLPSNGLSHWTVFQPQEPPFHPEDPVPDPQGPHPEPDPQEPHPVPDGGATLGLLGLAMLGLGVLRRRMR